MLKGLKRLRGEKMKCKICSKEILMDADGIWEGGHNAEPVIEGKCCERCNFAAVIPARLKEFELRRKDANT